MPGIARLYIDFAGGIHLPGGSGGTVRANGLPIQVLNGPVAGHGKSPHNGARMVTASSSVFADGIQVCRLGDVASCGHVSTGSPNVLAG